MQDIPYREFQRKLIPNIDPETIIGVRTPQLRHLARTLRGTQEAADFITAAPQRGIKLHGSRCKEEGRTAVLR